MLINFNLVPVEHVQPWGSPGDLSLSWFGLTDGQYWIQAGDAALLEYSQEARSKFGWPRYCDYHVVRLYEDLLEMVPYVLEIVPASLVPYISGESGAAWKANVAAWADKAGDLQDELRYLDIVVGSAGWIDRRTLDTAYLSPSANIRMWSDESTVHIEWDNTGKGCDGVPAWSATRGSFGLPRKAFIQEVRSFHERLMEQMTQRVERVVAGALPPEVQVDLHGLQHEHSYRCLPVENAFAGPPAATDWRYVRDGISQIERGDYGRQL